MDDCKFRMVEMMHLYLSGVITDEEMQELIDEVVISYGKEQAVSLNERCRLKKELFHALRKMDVLQELLDGFNVAYQCVPCTIANNAILGKTFFALILLNSIFSTRAKFAVKTTRRAAHDMQSILQVHNIVASTSIFE